MKFTKSKKTENVKPRVELEISLPYNFKKQNDSLTLPETIKLSPLSIIIPKRKIPPPPSA